MKPIPEPEESIMTDNTSTVRTRGSAAPGKSRLSKKAAAWAGAALLCLSACTTSDEKDPAPNTEKGILFALTSDYKTGSYSVVGIDSAFIANQIDPIHSDAVVRYLGGNDIFIINRLPRNSLQIVDRHNLHTVLEVGLPALSNPQDVELNDSLLYVAFYGTDKIGIYHQGEGAPKGEIDLSAYADSSDKLPETSDLLFVGDTLYALTQNLDTKNGFVPLTAHLLKIDITTRKVTQALELPYGNPAGMTYDPASGKLYIPCRGLYSNPDYSVKADGGIVVVDLSKFTIGDTLATEADLGGNVNQAILYKGSLYMDVGADAAEKIVAISVADGMARDIVDLNPYSVGGMAIDAKTSTLYLGDRKKGAERLRIFDADTFQEKEGSKLDLGMPPVDMVVVR